MSNTMPSFTRIGLIGRPDSESTHYSLQRLIAFLQQKKLEIHMDEATASVLPECNIDIKSRQSLAQLCDLIIVVGGDGSLLGAARSFAGHPVKLLGINRGRLGFLTDISPEEIETKVESVLDGKYLVETRFMLQSRVRRAGEIVAQGIALNDIVLHPGKFIRMIEFELSIDGDFVYRQRSDGLIVSSPTGSTAYALSGGGPIMHPSLDAIVLVPLNPHTLTSRPIVISGNSELCIFISHSNSLNPHITRDGQTHVVTHPGDCIEISKSERSIELVHPADHDFYDTCRNKLGWANQSGQE